MHIVEQKNIALNNQINEIFYNKAASFKEKALDALQKGNGGANGFSDGQLGPRGRRERQMQFGINSDVSDVRLKRVIDGEKMTTEKALD